MKARLYFESLGRSAQAKGKSWRANDGWPLFARKAFTNGWFANTKKYSGYKDK